MLTTAMMAVARMPVDEFAPSASAVSSEMKNSR